MKALMSYSKKHFYNSPSLYADKLKVDSSDNAFTREKNTLMVVNGEIISETKINVDEMYSNGIMKK